MNPNDIVKCLVPLPNLKALWLNGCPVVDACSNFSSIAELMPKLEIINSVLTAEAGEWAILFYARDQGAKTLEEISHLNLAGKGITYMKDATIFERMTNLRRLDLSGHPEFFMCEEKKEALEFQALHGLEKEQRKNVTFVGQNLSIYDVLPKLNSIEELVCDEDLELHIITKRAEKGYMPKLRVLNGVSMDVTDIGMRQKQRRVGMLLEKLQ